MRLMGSAGRRAKHYVDDIRALPLALPRRGRIAYVGWRGHHNVGDDAIFFACRQSLLRARFIRVPPGRFFRFLAAVNPKAIADGLLLGGGTLIGRPGFRFPVERLLSSYEDLPAFALGVGVEDPSFTAQPASVTAGELRRWVPLLHRFRSVTVRGPRSADILASLGISTVIVGDSALLLADERLLPGVEERTIGLNVAGVRGIWGGDQAALMEVLLRFTTELIGRGWRVRAIPLSPLDVPPTKQLAHRIGPRFQIVDSYRDVEDVMQGIRKCRILVGQRLHSVVLASAVHVPSIMVEYHPKCLDFQRTLGREAFTIRTDRVSARWLCEKVTELDEELDAHRRRLFVAVRRCQTLLRQHTISIEHAVFGAMSRP